MTQGLRRKHALFLLLSFFFTQISFAKLPKSVPSGADLSGPFAIRLGPELSKLLNEEDTDHDRKITVDDTRIGKGTRGDRSYFLKTLDGRQLEVRGVYFLSNLLQELKISLDQGKEVASLDPARVFESPVLRISRLIRENYWDGLTRRIDHEHLREILVDSKISSRGDKYLYVPSADEQAFQYFVNAGKQLPELKLKVVRLPSKVTPEFLEKLRHHHGLLSLALHGASSGQLSGVPFVVPGGVSMRSTSQE